MDKRRWKQHAGDELPEERVPPVAEDGAPVATMATEPVVATVTVEQETAVATMAPPKRDARRRPAEPVHVALPPEGDEVVLERGARLMLQYLPEYVAELVRDCHASTPEVGKLWQVIAGYVMRCAETGELMSPVFLPDWQDMRRADAPRPCGSCGVMLKPTHWSHTYCCGSCYFGRGGHGEDCALIPEDT